MNAFFQFFSTIGSLLKFAWQCFWAFVWLGWGLVVPHLIGPWFGFSMAEWTTYWWWYAPFLTWATARSSYVLDHRSQKYVYVLMLIGQSAMLIHLWKMMAMIAIQAGWALYGLPMFALLEVQGGWAVLTVNFLFLVSLFVEIWLSEPFSWRKQQIIKWAANRFFGRTFEASYSGAYGTARWLTQAEMKKEFTKDEEDPYQIILGVVPDGRRAFEKCQLAWASTDAHLLISAGNRSGKGASIIMPNLFYWKGSAIIIDCQREARWVTAKHRAEVLGQTVRWFDPELDPKDGKFNSHGINILALLDPYSYAFVGDVRELARVICEDGDPTKDNPFFDNSIIEALSCIIGILVASWHAFKKMGYDDPFPTMRDVAYVALNTPEYIKNWLKTTHETYIKQFESQGFLYGGQVNHDSILSFGRGFMKLNDETWTNILATMKNKLGFIADPQLYPLFSSNTINPNEICNGNTTVYINIPIAMINRYPAALRLILWAYIKEQERNGTATKKVLTVIDEMVKLGNMKMIHEYMIDAGAKYGLIMVGIIQDLITFKELVGITAYQSWSANTTYRLFSRIGSKEARQEVSELCGKATATSSSRSEGNASLNGVVSGLANSGGSSSSQEIARDLITPDEVGKLPNDEWIVIENGSHPAKIKKVAYKQKWRPFMQHPAIRGLGEKNPLHIPDGKRVYPEMPAEAMSKTIRLVEPQLYKGYEPPEYLRPGIEQEDAA